MNQASKPLPIPTPITQPFWDGARAGELRLQRCAKCQQHILYPRRFCPNCGSNELAWIKASGRGRLYSYVINHVAAPGWAGEAPYVIAVVELEEGPRMMSNLVGVPADPQALPLDMPLRVEFLPRGEMALPMFRPADTASHTVTGSRA